MREHRIKSQDAFYFNWGLRVQYPFQVPFAPSHANMAALDLQLEQAEQEDAVRLRLAAGRPT